MKLAIMVAFCCVGLLAAACGEDEDDSLSSETPASEPAPSAGKMVLAGEIPVAHTPEGDWQGEMPPPILAKCTEPLHPGAPDLRGLWRAYAVEAEGQPAPDHPLIGQEQRIEQCANRVVITAGRTIHDMRADGTLANGVNDVADADLSQEIQVAALFASGRLDLHPFGVDPKKPALVTREIVDSQLVWNYGPLKIRLRQVKSADPGQTPAE